LIFTDALDSISRKCDWHVFVRSAGAHAFFDAANRKNLAQNLQNIANYNELRREPKLAWSLLITKSL
jgi:hypothetical protein